MDNKSIDKARCFLYETLALLFVEEHTKNSKKHIIENLKQIALNPFDEEVGDVSKQIVELLENGEEDILYKEYQDLFLVPFGANISLSASWYYEERECGEMLVKVRDILANTQIRKDENLFKAPEDNFGFIFTLSSYLLEESNDDTNKELQKKLFEEVVNPYFERLYISLLSSKSPIYSLVGIILGDFLSMERTYLNLG